MLVAIGIKPWELMRMQWVANRSRGQAIVEAVGTVVVTSIMIGLLTGASYYLYVQQALITAARDAARIASVSSTLGDPATQAAAKTEVINYVKDYIEDTLGQTVGSQAVTVTPPSANGNQGSRQVTVEIAYDLETPAVAVSLMSSFSHSADNGLAIASFPVYAKATMRYEE
jgi:hypothetical protein